MKQSRLRRLFFVLVALLCIVIAVLVWWRMPDDSRSKVWQGLTSAAAILAVLAALAEFSGWNLRELWSKLRGQHPKGEYADFPFYVVHSHADLMKHLFPDVSQPVIPDRSIGYQPRGVEMTLDKLFETEGRILIRGRSKAGKTREAAELLQRHWHSGLLVLLLKPYERIQLPVRIPDEAKILHRNVVIFVDDVDHYCAPGDIIDSVEASSLPQQTSFPESLDHIIHYFEVRCGAAHEVRVLLTVRREDEFWSKLDYDAEKPPWYAVALLDLPDVPTESAQSFLRTIAQVEGMSLDPTMAQAIATENDGTFLNLVWALRDWKREGLSKIGQEQVEGFQGKLTRTWESRYKRAIEANPDTKSVYAAIDLLRQSSLTPYRNLIVQIAAVLDPTAQVIASDRVRLRARRFVEKSAWHLQKTDFVRALSRHKGLYQALRQLRQSRLGRLVEQRASTLLLYELPNARRIAQALDWLTRYEIPHRNGILLPYDGQVDGRGEFSPSSEGIASILLPAGSLASESGYILRLLRVAKQLHEAGSFEECERLLDGIIQSGSWLGEAHRERGWVRIETSNFEGALADFDRLQELVPGSPFGYTGYTGKAWAYWGLKDYKEAIAEADKATKLWPQYFSAYSCRSLCYAACGDYQLAMKEIEQAISIRPEASWPWVDKASILIVRNQVEEALKVLEHARKLDASSMELYREKARAFLAVGEMMQAALAVQEGLDQVANAVRFLGHVSQVYYESGYFGEAIDYARQALSRDSRQTWIRYRLALAMLADGQTQDALAEYDRAIALSRRPHMFRRAIGALDELATRSPDLDGLAIAKANLHSGLEAMNRNQEGDKN